MHLKKRVECLYSDRMAGEKQVSSSLLLTNLNVDVSLLICRNLDIKSRRRLACTCRLLRDLLYIPTFWKDVQTAAIKIPNIDAGHCAVKRNIEIEYLLRIDVREVDDMTTDLLRLLEDTTLKGSLRSLHLLLGIHDKVILDVFYRKAKSVSKIFQNRHCLKVELCPEHQDENLVVTYICKVFQALFPMMPQLTDLRIYQYPYLYDTAKDCMKQLVNYHLPHLKYSHFCNQTYRRGLRPIPLFTRKNR